MATMALPIKINLHQKLICLNFGSNFNVLSAIFDGLILQSGFFKTLLDELVQFVLFKLYKPCYE